MASPAPKTWLIGVYIRSPPKYREGKGRCAGPGRWPMASELWRQAFRPAVLLPASLEACRHGWNRRAGLDCTRLHITSHRKKILNQQTDILRPGMNVPKCLKMSIEKMI